MGDKLVYSRYSPVPAQKDLSMGIETVRVCAIVDAFPGYSRYKEDGEENYMVICNLAAVTSKFSVTPYSVWIKLNEGDSAETFHQEAQAQGISFESWNSLEKNLTESKESSLIQITNTLFGIYRAMGMGIRKVYGIVFTEQLICFAGAVTAGGCLGMLASIMCIPLLAIVYLPKKHNISIQMHFLGMDILQIGVVLLGAAVVCFIVMLRILKNMKIAQALKMGED